MQFVKPVIVAFSLAALACGSAFAAGTSGTTSKSTSSPAASGSSSSTKSDEFSRMDKNHDGKVSRDEWKAAHKSSASGGSSSKSTSK
jgi:EF hand domain-containing protein